MIPMNTTLLEERISNTGLQWPQDLSIFTPLMKQYLEIKYSYDLDILLLFQVGDFYECFFEDAKVLSCALELTLTSRAEANYPPRKIPMAGIPIKAGISYVSKLLEKGFKVAICDQTEDPALTKTIVKREVTKLLTPGTILETDWLESTKNNYLGAIIKDKKNEKYGFSYADVSCGEFYFTEVSQEELIGELNRLNPSEIIVPYKLELSLNKITKEKVLEIDPIIKDNWFCTGLEMEYFNNTFIKKRIIEELEIVSLQSIGASGLELGLQAAGGILAYIDKTQPLEKPRFQKLKPYYTKSFLVLDKTTRKNLELTQTIKDGSFHGSLLWAIDYTKTIMGKRRLRSWLGEPLLETSLINTRLSCIEELIKNKTFLYEIGQILEKIFDIERISTRLSALSVHARELIALKNSLSEIPSLGQKLKNFTLPFFKKFTDFPKEIIEVINLIEKSIIENPPLSLTEGNLIKDTFNSEIKSLREIIENSDSWLKSYEEIERKRTNIKNLKVGFNRTFGYFIEISKGNLPLVPDDYICKQTMVNSSRFITEELKDFEQKALHAEHKIKNLEYELFCDIREQVKKYSPILRELAFNISNLDALYSLCQAAIINNFSRPIIDNSDIIELKASRHPVIEKKIGFNNFIPNDCLLQCGDSKNQLMILTGPNMAGKSTFMRQIALIVILAQIGSYVPCDFARIGLIDKIFTRVGAADDISEGQSTFMVEMTETTSILNNMTKRSLILLDEVGRGTSTYDGVAIAWALAEYLVKNKCPRTIFATHFHELNGLADFYSSICNYQVTVKEEKDHVVFLRKVIPGSGDKSYGIEVAKMAGLPKELLARARTIMNAMNIKSKSPVGAGFTPAQKETIKSQIESGQLKLFG